MRLLGFLIILLALVYGGHLWFERKAASERAALVRSVTEGKAPDGAGDLPQIVRDFVRVSGAQEGQLARLVRFTQEAEIEMQPGKGFNPALAEQWITTGEAGFLWRAQQDLGPVPLFVVTDAFLDGTGRLNVRLFGSFPMASASGPDIDRAEAMRYLAELPWAPDAILGNPDLIWRYVGPREVAVAMDTNGGPAEVTLVFDEAGDISEIRARDRPATGPDGETVLRDWRGIFRNYGEMGGRRIPREAEVGYIYEDGYAPYFRGKITSYEVLD